jgi:hypothetical protein
LIAPAPAPPVEASLKGLSPNPADANGIPFVLVRFDHIARVIVNANHSSHSFRLVSSNGMTRSTLPVESKM